MTTNGVGRAQLGTLDEMQAQWLFRVGYVAAYFGGMVAAISSLDLTPGRMYSYSWGGKTGQTGKLGQILGTGDWKSLPPHLNHILFFFFGDACGRPIDGGNGRLEVENELYSHPERGRAYPGLSPNGGLVCAQ